jgi:4-amino-4-deoxy-L-arabinose transferase-like glycosyltransferase
MIALFDTRPRRGWLAGLLLGVAILGKAFVPAVLFVPVFLIARGKRLAILAASAAVAAPWHLLSFLRHGEAFWNEYFWTHQVGRFLDPALEHVQPFWYYAPVLLAGLFPWTPLAVLLARPKTYEDVRIRFLALFSAAGLVFFSASRNKLPGYVLPLMPPLAVVLAAGLDRVGRSLEDQTPGRAQAWWLGSCTILLAALPAVARALPEALLAGVSRVAPVYGLAIPLVVGAGLVWILAWTGRAQLAVLAAALAAALGAGYVKLTAFPALDREVSVRAFWHQNHPGEACLDGVARAWEYGLNYYAGRPLESCADSAGARARIFAEGGRLRIRGR